MESYLLKIKDIIRETDDAVVLDFAVPDALKGSFNFLAGQYLTLGAEINGKKIWRMYSICNDLRSGKLQVGIKKIPNGIFSTYVNDVLQVGDKLMVQTPKGKFVLSTRSNNQKHYVFIAAGSGVTPLLCMIKTIVTSEPFSTIDLFYGNKNWESTMFKEELAALSQKYPAQFNCHFTFSQLPYLNHTKGRINGAWIKNVFVNKKQPIDAVYLCGPEPMIIEVREFLTQQMQVEDFKIHFELFTSAAKLKKNQQKLSLEEFDFAEVKIVVDGKGHQLKVGKDEKILDVILAHDIDVRHSCMGGLCTQCQAKLTYGEVEMLKNIGLTDEEMQQHLVLTCQSVPRSKEILLNFDH